jgi:protein CpxP
MRKVTAAVMASTLALSAFSQAAEVVTGDNWHPTEGSRSVAVRAICLTA